MKNLCKILSLFLLIIASFFIPSKLTYASTDSDYIYDLNIRPKHDEPSIGDDSLYYGYVYLNQYFNRNVYEYTATVKNEVKNVRVEVSTKGNITVTGNTEYDLEVGENIIKVVATTADGISKEYTITITRLVADEDNTDLSSLYVSDRNNTNYIKNFDPTITSYNVIVENEVSEVEIWGITSVGTSKLTGRNKFKLKTGNNKFTLTVTSKSGKTKNYIINVERKKSSDASLFDIILNGESLNIGDKKNYTVNVPYDTSTVNIEVYVLNNATKVKGLGEHKLKVGTNKIKLTVIAEDGTKNTYTLKVIRKKPSTELNDIQINGYTYLVGGNTLSLDVNYSTDTVTIKGTPVDKSAKVTGNGTYNLKVGKNTFTIKVKAANGKTKKYKIIVNRSKYKKIKAIIIWY